MAQIESVELQIRINSALTVQSDKNGFFRDFCENVFLIAKEQDNWLERVFSKCTTNEQRIALLLDNNTPVSDIILSTLSCVKAVYREKNALISMKRRVNAEKLQVRYFSEKDSKIIKDALLEASVALIQAPAKDVNREIDGGLSLALAYRTRAHILLSMGEGELAVNDFKLAVLHGFDIQDNADYYLKLAACYTCMGQWSRAEISLKLSEHIAVKNPSVASILAESVKTCRKNLIEQRSTEQNLLQAIKKRSTNNIKPYLTNGKNSELESASNRLKLVQSREKGQYIVASEQIDTGDILLVEKPIAACLLPTHFSTNCHHCFIRLMAPPIPCCQCSGVAFCSVACMQEACNSYHRYECQYMNLYIGSGMSILCYIALRIFTQTEDIEDALKLSNDLYKNLCSHTDNRLTEDHLQRGLMAIFLLRCLKSANYLNKKVKKTSVPDNNKVIEPTIEGVNTHFDDIELKVGIALMGLLQILQYNAHEIYERLYKINNKYELEHPFESSTILYIGAGLYKTGAYFNHECWPTVARYFVGRDLILSAIRPHNANDTIAENYGPIFTKHSKTERLNKLNSRYLFRCECTSCTENWPILNKIPDAIRFRCPMPKCTFVFHAMSYPLKTLPLTCSRCHQTILLTEQINELADIEQQYTEGAKAMQNKKVNLAINLLKTAINKFFKIAVLPHRPTHMAQEALISCYSTLQMFLE